MATNPKIGDPDWEAGKDWTHRIDAVPELNRLVDIRTRAGTEYLTRTVASCDRRRVGIGSEVAYCLDGGFRIEAENVAFWKYR